MPTNDFVFIFGNNDDETRMTQFRDYLEVKRVLDSYKLGPGEWWYCPRTTQPINGSTCDSTVPEDKD